MNTLRRTISNMLTRHVPKPVYGRWGTEYSAKQLDARIDLANEDHCGPCGNYRLDKHTEKTKKNTHNSCSDDYFAMIWEDENIKK